MKTPMIRLSCLSASLILIFATSSVSAKQYYKWVDANGSTHYTTTPPPKGAKRLDKISTYGSSTQNTNPPKAQQPQNENQPSESQSNQKESKKGRDVFREV